MLERQRSKDSIPPQVLVDRTFVNTPNPIVISFVPMIILISNLGMILFQYIKQIPEMNGFLKKNEGWQLNLEKAATPRGNPIPK